MASESNDNDVVITFDEFDDDDDLDNLFSFATAPQDSPIAGGAPTSPRKLFSGDAVLNSMSLPMKPGHGDDEENLSDTSEDSFMDFLEDQKEPLTLLEAPTKAKVEKEPTEEKDTEEDEERRQEQNLKLILDWLDKDDEEAAATSEESPILPPEPIVPAAIDPETQESETSTKSSKIDFASLEEAVKSSQSSLGQLRDFLNNPEQGFGAVTEKVRPNLWCKFVCGQTLEQVSNSSEAKVFQDWHAKWHEEIAPRPTEKAPAPLESNPESNEDEEKPQIEVPSVPSKEVIEESNSNPPEEIGNEGQTKDSDKTKEENVVPKPLTKYQKVQKKWVQQQSKLVAPRILEAQQGDVKIYEQQMEEVLSFYFQRIPSDGSEEVNNDEVCTRVHDPLIPPMISTVLAAGIPPDAASVLVSRISSNITKTAALSPKEREKAGLVLHQQFHRLAGYHFPSLVLHLDRYAPDWYYWPECKMHGPGFLSQSFLISNFAGDSSSDPNALKEEKSDDGADSSQFSNPLALETVLKVWDLLLASSNVSMRFFLVLTILEVHADKLIPLTDQALKDELQKVFSFQTNALRPTSDTSEGSGSHAKDWIDEWTDKAQLLWERTPLSISRRLIKVEEQAIREAVKQRQKDADERSKLKLESEAQARHEALEAERERKADEARLRLTRARLVAFYRQYNPGKEDNIDKIMESYKGRYEVLDAKLKQKYGVGFNPAIKPKPQASANTNKQKANKGPSFGGFMGQKAKEITDREVVEERRKTQIVAKTAPSEVMPILCWNKERHNARMNQLDRGNKLIENEAGRLPLRFFIVDSRPAKTAQAQGKLKASASLNPEELMDPDLLLKKEIFFEELRGAVHIVIMGEGFAAFPVLYGHKMNRELAGCIREDDMRNMHCAQFFLKIGFPFVSVMDGGFAGAHSFLSRQGTRHNLRLEDSLCDYDPEVSIFGQFERVRNSSGPQKAQRAIQHIFDSSMVALTKNSKRFESLSSELGTEDRPPTKPAGNMMTRFFSGVGEEQKKPREVARENPSKESGGPVFRNPFARKSEVISTSQELAKPQLVEQVVAKTEATATRTESVKSKAAMTPKQPPPEAVPKPDAPTTSDPSQTTGSAPSEQKGQTSKVEPTVVPETTPAPALAPSKPEAATATPVKVSESEKTPMPLTAKASELKPESTPVSAPAPEPKQAPSPAPAQVSEPTQSEEATQPIPPPPPPQTSSPRKTPLSAFAPKSSETLTTAKVGSTTTTADATPKTNRFAGFGQAFNTSLKAATKVAGEAQTAAARQRNKFARFGAPGAGLGSSQHGGTTNASGTNEAGPGLGMARNLAGFNQFRKHTMARMRNDGGDKSES